MRQWVARPAAVGAVGGSGWHARRRLGRLARSGWGGQGHDVAVAEPVERNTPKGVFSLTSQRGGRHPLTPHPGGDWSLCQRDYPTGDRCPECHARYHPHHARYHPHHTRYHPHHARYHPHHARCHPHHPRCAVSPLGGRGAGSSHPASGNRKQVWVCGV